MNTRVLVLLSLLVGIGFVLHYAIPPIMFGMKPDMSLAMMFLGIILFPRFKYVLLLSILTGFVSGLTTSFPMGQMLNIIEKPLTAIAFFGLYVLVKNISTNYIKAPILTIVGTLMSGTIFLFIGLHIIGIDVNAGFVLLFTANVLPAVVLNTIVMVIIYPVVQEVLKRSQPIVTS